MNLEEMQRKYIIIHREKRTLEIELDELKAEAAALEQALAEMMAANGMRNVSMTDGSGVHIRTDRYVSKKSDFSQKDVCDVLESLGLGYMVAMGYNASSLKSFVRELQDTGKEVPEQLASMLNIGEIQRVIVTGI